MAFNEIVVILYVVDILDYSIFEDSWGIGMMNCTFYRKLHKPNNYGLLLFLIGYSLFAARNGE
jgi:hypothetical protein